MCPSGTGSCRREIGGAVADRNSTWTDFRQAFEIIDADHDGKISREDLHKFYNQFSTGFDFDIIGTMMSVADSNKDGFVEYDEFEHVLNQKIVLPPQQPPQKAAAPSAGMSILKDVFMIMDKDGDGFLSHGDLKSYMNSAGFPANDEDITAMIRLAVGGGGGGSDCCGNGREGVSFEGLLKILAFDNLAY